MMFTALATSRKGVGKNYLMLHDTCIVSSLDVNTILDIVNIKSVPADMLIQSEKVTVVSCLIDVANKTVNITKFSDKKQDVGVVSISKFKELELQWIRNPRFKYYLTLTLGQNYKQILYVTKGVN